MSDPQALLDPRDVRFDSYQTANENPYWSVSATHIPTGIRVGPYEGKGVARPAWASRQSLMAKLTAAVRGDPVLVPREATDRMVKAMEAYQAEVWSWDRGPLEGEECKELWRRLLDAAERPA